MSTDTTKAARDERPAKLEIGQRWQVTQSSEGHQPGDIVRVTGGKPGVDDPLAYPLLLNERTGATGSHGKCFLLDADAYAHATYLGGPPQSQVAVGQHRVSKSSKLHFVVELVGAELRRRYMTTGNLSGRVYTAEEMEETSTLLTDAPATPVTSGVPRDEPAKWCGCPSEPCVCQNPVLASPSPTLREVSPDGKAWINYDRLTDSDAFEAYRWRRLDGVVAAMVEAPGVRIVGTYGQPKIEGCTLSEGFIAQQMRNRDASNRKPESPASKPLPLPQSHATTWGGLWSLRAPDVDVKR